MSVTAAVGMWGGNLKLPARFEKRRADLPAGSAFQHGSSNRSQPAGSAFVADFFRAAAMMSRESWDSFSKG